MTPSAKVSASTVTSRARTCSLSGDSQGSYDRLAGFAAELVRLKVEVVVTLSTEAALAAKKATASIPIVFTQVSDPVASGVVSNLARPAGI
jgi:putative tryptophan/tyrosine transport system substrate-binding protein